MKNYFSTPISSCLGKAVLNFPVQIVQDQTFKFEVLFVKLFKYFTKFFAFLDIKVENQLHLHLGGPQ